MKKIATASVLLVLAVLIGSSPAMAFSSTLTAWKNCYAVNPSTTCPPGGSSLSGANANCALCHDTKTGPNLGWNAYGNLIRTNIGLGNVGAFKAAESTSSVNVNGGTNDLDEIKASTQPGWTTGNNSIFDSTGALVASIAAPASIGTLDPPPVGNHPPVLNPIANQTVNEGQLLQVTATATDPDGNALTFSMANEPTGATLTPGAAGTATFSWTPNFSQGGTNYSPTIIVTDNGSPALSAQQTFTITVGDVNRPPVLSPVANQTVNENQLLQFNVSATDPDGDTLSFSIANQPTGATLTDNHNGTATFTWTPSFTQSGNYTNVTITVTDNGSPALNASQPFTITVGDVNRPPVLTPIGARTTNENQLLQFTISATDPDGNALSFAATSSPAAAGATFTDNHDGTATFAWTPDFSQAGNYSVTVTVTDNGSPALNASETFTITVGDVNRPPVLSPIGNRTVNEGQALTINITASDPDGGALSFAATSTPAAAGATFTDNHNGTATFAWTPSFSQAGSYSVTVTVTDAGTPALSASETFTITVGNINRAPTVTNPGPKTVDEGQLLSFTISGSDPDGNALTFAATGLPSGATLSPSGAFSWTPSFTQAGSYSVTVTATDNGSPALTSAPQTFTITVNNVNRAPTVTNPGNKTVPEGQLLSFTITGSDPDGDTLTFAATGLPTGATLSPSGAFSWTPATGQAGSYSVTVTATDNGSPALTSTPQTFTITVSAVNHAPTVTNPGPKTVDEGQLLSFTITGSDPDGNALTFAATGLPSGATLSPSGAFSWTPSFTQAGSYSVTVTATDNGSPALTSAPQTFTITVNNVNRAPTVTNPGNKTVPEGQLLSFTITGSDPDGDTLTFAATGLPTGATLSPSGAFSWTPATGQAGSYSVTVTATDNGSPALTSAPQTFTITVNNVNRAPTVTNPGPKTVDEGQLLSFTISGSDPDGNALTFAATGLPSGATLSPSGAFSWTPSFTQAGSYSVTVTATDNGSPALTSAPQTFTITVNNVNRAPTVTNPGNKTVTEGQLLSFTITGSDPDGDTLSFTSANLPAGATLTPSGAFSWTPAVGQAGIYSVTVTATDNGSPALTSAPQTFSITVNAVVVNHPPVLTNPGNKTVNEGQLLSFTLTASDPDGNALTFASANLPAGATLSTSGAFGWTPSFTQAGTYPVTVTVTDNGSPAMSASQTFSITVNNVNRAPTVTNPGNKTVTEGQLLSFTISGSDPDGDTLTFAATGLPTGATLSPSGAFSWTPATGQAGSYSLTVTATDNGSPALTSAPQTFSITVQPPGTTTGYVRIKEAEWDDSKLKVKGTASPSRVMVTVINADSGNTIGTVMANSEGEWKMEVRLTPAPCRVQAKAGVYSSAVTIVEDAPRSCR